MPVTIRQRNIQSRNIGRKVLGGKISNKKTSSWKSTKKAVASEVLVTNAPTDSAGIMFPSPRSALLCLLGARLAAALWVHITDCDETYNYWEPLHYLIYGSGMQTWEYSPAYAVRSYAPLALLAAPFRLLNLFVDTRPSFVFYTVRCLLAVATALCEAMFYRGVCQQFGVHVARMWLVVAATSCGQFVSSAALLPSAWCSALVSAALASWWLNRLPHAVGFIALSALVAWPFSAVLGVPIAFDIVILRKRPLDFVKWCAVSLAVILPPLVAIDTWYYGRLTLAPWNIVAYNIFTEHGPDLYGVEPWTFYLLNGFLNFNIIWVMALLSPVFLSLCWLLITQARPLGRPNWLTLGPLWLWLGVFLLQPHKEERFLFPVYSMIVLSGAVSVDCAQKLTYSLRTALHRAVDRWTGRADKAASARTHYLAHTNFVMVIFIGIAVLGGVSRIAALYHNYHAPMRVLRALPTPAPAGARVCLGKDWHRWPSSFLLPTGYRVGFVRSDFDGQLPAQFDGGDNATRLVHEYFNDANRGDSRTYLNESACHYMVDSDVEPATARQPAYHLSHRWAVVDKIPFLDSARSHRLFRAFHVPVFGAEYVKFGSVYLLRNVKLVS